MDPRANGVRASFTKRADEVLVHRAGSDHNHPLYAKGPVMAETDSIAARRAAKPRSSFSLNIIAEVAAMQRKTVRELREQYEEVFSEECRSNHKQWLIKRIAWRMQANEEGDLSERARRRAAELANDSDLRMKAPPQKKETAPSQTGSVVHEKIATNHDPRIPMPGVVITRKYKGEAIRVKILPDAFEYEGETYQSLSSVAKAITGTHTNGFLFFRLNGKKETK
jgi:hypothetical protein